MRKFVVSDLYGDREMFSMIFSYLENLSLQEDVLLIINGNLVDGNSFQILDDICEKINHTPSLQIQYIGGNKELELYQKLPKNHEWSSFLGNLDTYYLGEECIFHRPILIAHGSAPMNTISMKIKDNNAIVFDVVNKRLDLFNQDFATRKFHGVLGRGGFYNPSYFLIKGGTPIHNPYGFFYNSYEHYLVIDGGCQYYLRGDVSYDHVPLVEIEDERITLLTFNHQNEILSGFVFDGQLKEMDEEEIQQKRIYLGEYLLDSRREVKELRK